MIISLYGDDMLVAARSMRDIAWLKSMLIERFDMRELGEAKSSLGMEIYRDRKVNVLSLNHEYYMEKWNDLEWVNTNQFLRLWMTQLETQNDWSLYQKTLRMQLMYHIVRALEV